MPPTFESSVTVGLRPGRSGSQRRSSSHLVNNESTAIKQAVDKNSSLDMSGDATTKMIRRTSRTFSSPDTHKMEVSPNKAYLWEFFHKEPSLYCHQVFQHAAEVFEALSKDDGRKDNGRINTKHRRGNAHSSEKNIELPVIDFANENDKRLTFTLVFQTLKCE